MPPLKLEASERLILLKPRELTSSALDLEMRVSMITAIAGLWHRDMLRKFMRKLLLPAPLQFQTRIFISEGEKGFAWWITPDLRSHGVGLLNSWVKGFSKSWKVHGIRYLRW